MPRPRLGCIRASAASAPDRKAGDRASDDHRRRRERRREQCGRTAVRLRHPVLPGRHRRVPDPAGRRRRLEHRPVDPHPQDGPHRARLRLREHRVHRVQDHVHRRRAGHPALSRLPDRAARRALHLPRGRLAPHLRRAAEHRPARRVRREDPSPHAAPRGPQAVLLGAAAHRAPDGGALERRLRALDVLRGQLRPARPRPRRAHDGAPAREAARDRGLRAQEEHRPGLPLPRQLAELRRQLPAPELRQHGRAVRDRPGALEGARPPAHPPRGPRAERVDVDRAPRRLHRARTCTHRSPPASRPSRARCTAERTRPCCRCSPASATRARASRSSSSA